MKIENLLNTLFTNKDFENFLKILKEDFSLNKTDWENKDIESYIEGIYGYVHDINEKAVIDSLSIEPSWKLFAEILIAAKVYE